MALIGVGKMLSDVIECANLLDKRVTMMVLNVPEQKRERTKGFETRLKELHECPVIMRLEDFVPQEGEEYFLVPSTPKKVLLVELLRKNYDLRFSQLIHPQRTFLPLHISDKASLSEP